MEFALTGLNIFYLFQESPMDITNLFRTESSWDVNAISESRKTYSKVQQETTPSGDTVDISDEARELYSKMIHKYDKASTSDGQTGGGEGNGGSGGDGMSESTNSVEAIKNQIQALKSQIMSLASQAQSGGPGSAAMSQMNALEAQVAALEVQLNEMAQA